MSELKSTYFHMRMSESTKKKLRLLAEQDDRTQAYIVEKLIKEAYKKLTLTK
jgi:predicted DNA-binding protein